MSVRSHAVSHSGKVREQNEDYYLSDEALGLYIVCDGVTHPFGAYCARTTAEGIRSHLRSHREILERHTKDSTAATRQDLSRLIRGAIEHTSAKIYDEGQRDPQKRGMFSTAVVAVVSRGFAFIAHLGDSRAYSIRDGGFVPLTRDHTFLNSLLQSGKSFEEARKTIYSSNLSAAVGYQPVATASVIVRELAPGEQLLLCTDGLSDHFENGHAPFRSGWPEITGDRLANALRDHALAKGARDNLTAVVIEFSFQDEPTKKNMKVANNVLQKLGTIRGIRLFQHLGDSSLMRFLSLADTRTYPAGATLIQKGILISEMFIVLEGEISVDFGRGPIEATESKGAVLGEMSLFDGSLPYATIKAKAETTVLVVSRDALFNALREDADFAARFELGLLQAVIRRLRARTEPDEELRNLSNYSVVSIFPAE